MCFGVFALATLVMGTKNVQADDVTVHTATELQEKLGDSVAKVIENNNTVQLLSDYEVDGMIRITGDMTIDFNGHYLKQKAEQRHVLYLNGGTLTLRDAGGIENGYGIIWMRSGNLKMVVDKISPVTQEGKKSGVCTLDVYEDDGAATIQMDDGNMYIEDAYITNCRRQSIGFGGGNLTIDDVTMEAGTSAIETHSIFITDTIVINDGSFTGGMATGTNVYNRSAIFMNTNTMHGTEKSNTTVIINGGTFDGGDFGNALWVNSGVAKVNGGTFKGSSGIRIDEGKAEISGEPLVTGTGDGINASGGNLVISGNPQVTSQNYSALSVWNDANVIASGGTYTGKTNGAYIGSGQAYVNGGTFTGIEDGICMNGGTVCIIDGTFEGGTTGSWDAGLYICGAKAYVAGGVFSGKFGIDIWANNNGVLGELTLAGGEVTGQTCGLRSHSTEIAMSGGTLSAANGEGAYVENSDLTLSGGSFEGNVGLKVYAKSGKHTLDIAPVQDDQSPVFSGTDFGIYIIENNDAFDGLKLAGGIYNKGFRLETDGLTKNCMSDLIPEQMDFEMSVGGTGYTVIEPASITASGTEEEGEQSWQWKAPNNYRIVAKTPTEARSQGIQYNNVDMGYGNNSASLDQYIVEGKITILKAPAKEGYTFAGWYTDETYTTQICALQYGDNASVYAKWNPEIPGDKKRPVFVGETTFYRPYDSDPIDLSKLIYATNTAGDVTYTALTPDIMDIDDETGLAAVKGLGNASFLIETAQTEDSVGARQMFYINISKSEHKFLTFTPSYFKKVTDKSFDMYLALGDKRTEGVQYICEVTDSNPKGKVIAIDDGKIGRVNILGAGEALIRITATESDSYCETSVYARVKVTDDTVSVTPQNPNVTTSIANAKISGLTSMTYTGKSLTQSKLKVVLGNKTLKLNTDYKLTYTNNKTIGTAKVTITGMGSYTGTLTRNFTISVKKNKVYTVKNIKYKITNTKTNGQGTVTITGTTKKKTDKKFTSLTIGSTVTIGGKAFKITAVSSNAFNSYSYLKKVTVGKNVTSIGSKAFYKCKRLATVKSKTTKLKKIGSMAFSKIKTNAQFQVPKAKYKTYKKLFTTKIGYKKSMKLKKI